MKRTHLLGLILALALAVTGCTVVQEAPEPPEPAVPTVPSFVDVGENDWFYDAVDFCCGSGMMNGVTETHFFPNAPMTRAMLVTVLWRGAGSPEAISAGFADVPREAWYTDAVNWASENSIVNGVGDNVFAPDSPITREQTAAILHRWSMLGSVETKALAQTGGPETLTPYADTADISPWAIPAMQWAVANGLLSGFPGETPDAPASLRPEAGTSRAQLGAILMRLLGTE